MYKWKIFKTDIPKGIPLYYSIDDDLLGEIVIDEKQAKLLVCLLNELSDTHIYLVRQEKEVIT